jgi:hypothetical protein
LASEAFEGRATGRVGERLAARYLADQFRAAGLEPAGDGGFFQRFEFTSGVRLGTGNLLESERAGAFALDKEWRPLAFSEVGSFGPAPVVFAGYGFAAPASGEIPAVDSYGEVDVSGAWLLVLRDWPEGATDEERQHWGRYAGLRYKAILARERGAAGVAVVQRPAAKDAAGGSLIPLRFDGTAGDAGLPVLSLSEPAADRLLGDTGHTIASLRGRLDGRETLGAFSVPDTSLRAEIRLGHERGEGINVVGRLGAGDPKAPALVVGAHYDHLGRAARRGSLARGEERDGIHYGADDNASGVAAVIEIARTLGERIAMGTLAPTRDAIFAAWSGEELGLLGSHAFVTGAAPATEDEAGGAAAPSDDPHAAHAVLSERFAANLNLDMVGRLRERLLVQGAASSTRWPAIVEAAMAAVSGKPLRIEVQDDSLLPTDASSFVTRGVPVLSGFSGAHREYHTPRDTPDTLNYEGLDAVTRLFSEVADLLLRDSEAPDFVAPQHKAGAHPRRAVRLRAYLGTVPDYATSTEGMALATVVAGGPAARAGLRGGDVVVELGGRPVRNVYDYTFAIEALRPGQPVVIVITRDDKGIELEIVPEARN